MPQGDRKGKAPCRLAATKACDFQIRTCNFSHLLYSARTAQKLPNSQLIAPYSERMLLSARLIFLNFPARTVFVGCLLQHFKTHAAYVHSSVSLVQVLGFLGHLKLFCMFYVCRFVLGFVHYFIHAPTNPHHNTSCSSCLCEYAHYFMIKNTNISLNKQKHFLLVPYFFLCTLHHSHMQD